MTRSRSLNVLAGMATGSPRGEGPSRRGFLKVAGAGAAGLLALTSIPPERAYAQRGADDGGGGGGSPASGGEKSDVQYDIGAFVPPPISFKGIPFALGGPSHTQFLTARLTRKPTARDRRVLGLALAQIERSFSWSPAGVFVFVAYGLPYFGRLPHRVVAAHMPRLRSEHARWALEEAVPTTTDITARGDPLNRPRFGGRRFSVMIEDNDVLLSLRSDLVGNLQDVERWLKGSDHLNGRAVPSPRFAGLFHWTSSRHQFVQIGLPRRIADAAGLPFAGRIHPDSPMWFGLADQNVDGAGPPAITCFQGNDSARLARFPDRGRYFSNGTIQVLTHDISDLQAWYDDPANSDFRTQLDLMFRATHRFGNGGGTPFWRNQFFGDGDAARGATGTGTSDRVHRLGHLACLQRSSRAEDGTPIHARMDGPGFDDMDTAGNHQPGRNVAKLQFSAFVPTAESFRRMRVDQASLDLVRQHDVRPDNNGIERFITATRRQNFLMPPRRHRVFPLLELT
jgi:hypothetical protein